MGQLDSTCTQPLLVVLLVLRGVVVGELVHANPGSFRGRVVVLEYRQQHVLAVAPHVIDGGGRDRRIRASRAERQGPEAGRGSRTAVVNFSPVQVEFERKL
jgi:hypothetical protein